MIDLPHLAPPELAVAGALHRRRAPLAVTLPQGTLRLWPTLDPAEIARPYRLALALGEGRAVLATEAELAESLLGRELGGGLSLEGVDPALARLVEEHLAAPLLQAAEAALGRSVRLDADRPNGRTYRLDFAASLDGAGPWPVAAELDLRALEIVTRSLERVPTEPAALDGLLVPLTAEIGRTWLGAEELARAEPGDLLLVETAAAGQGRIDLVLGGVLALPCTIEGAELIYAGGARERMDDPGAAAVAERLDEVPLEISFELGRLALPLGELRTLAPGHVFELGRDLRNPVDLVLAGRKIGEGELVQVGDRLGVRLRTIVPR